MILVSASTLDVPNPDIGKDHTKTSASANGEGFVSVSSTISPFIFRFEGYAIVPADSVYAAFEAKQAINAAQVEYAQKKKASVRRLCRTRSRLHCGARNVCLRWGWVLYLHVERKTGDSFSF
jgi:hypothetical protein